MANKFRPQIRTEKKKAPKTPRWLLILIWVLFGTVLLLDVYRFVVSPNGISFADIFWDMAILVVAVYLTARNHNKV